MVYDKVLIPHALFEYEYETVYNGRVTKSRLKIKLRLMDLEYYISMGARLVSAEIFWIANKV